MAQASIPCSVYRGGTSRGLFFKKGDLPEEKELQKEIFTQGIDAYNPSQIDGLGSGTSHTSKVCVVSKSNLEDADIDYTFYQIGIGNEIIDSEGTCGNLMVAVASFAVDEGLVDYSPIEGDLDISVYNTNINRFLHITVPVVDGEAKVMGDYIMPGLTQSGAKYSVSILKPGGGKTGKTLPLGSQYSIETNLKKYNISFVDVINPFVFVSSDELGISGTETNDELSKNDYLINELEEIRVYTALAAGMSNTLEEARKIKSIPKVAIVNSPQRYLTSLGEIVNEEDIDIVARMVSMGNFHRTFAASGLYCLAAASLLPNTIPNTHLKIPDMSKGQGLRIGHQEGAVNVRSSLTEDGQDVSFVGLDRTARRIMKGELFYRKKQV